MKIESIPTDAAQFRGWKNSFLTKTSSIDKTGQNRILQWLVRAFSPDTNRELLEVTLAEMPRLDAHLASVLMDPRHLKGELLDSRFRPMRSLSRCRVERHLEGSC